MAPEEEDQRTSSSRLTFDGTGNYEAFKLGMMQRLRARTHLTRQQRTVYLFEALRGDALQHIMTGMPGADDDDEEMGQFPFARAADIWARLNARYGLAGTMTRTDAITKIMSLRQGNRNVDDFTTEFNQYAHHTGWDDTTIIATYFRALNSGINMAVGVVQPNTWPEAVRAAKRGEELSRSARQSQGQRQGNGRGRGRGGFRQAQGRGAREEGPQCYNCNEYGHISRSCPQNNAGQRHSDQRSGGGNRRGRGGTARGRQTHQEPHHRGEAEEVQDDYDLELPGNA